MNEIKDNKAWSKLVAEAKKICSMLKLKTEQRIKVAEICIRACDISWGGRKLPEIYTVKKFANEININYKTISNWLHLKRNVIDKMTPEMQNKAVNINCYSPLHFAAAKIKSDMTTAQIETIYKNYADVKPGSAKFKKYVKHAGTILYNAKNPALLKDVPDDDLVDIISVMKTAIGLFEQELRIRSKSGELTDKRFKKANIKPHVEAVFETDEMSL